MRKRASGVIVNVSSAAGRVGLPFLAPYCASKHAVEGLTEAMSYELTPFGIRIKLVEPGGVKTSFTNPWTPSAPYNPEADRVREQYSIWMQKAAGPEGVAKAIFRAATDGAAPATIPYQRGGHFPESLPLASGRGLAATDPRGISQARSVESDEDERAE